PFCLRRHYFTQEYELPTILTSKPSSSLPMPYLQLVIFEATKRLVSKCFVICFILYVDVSLISESGTTSISERHRSTPRFDWTNFLVMNSPIPSIFPW